jgi:hypothetical protein
VTAAGTPAAEASQLLFAATIPVEALPEGDAFVGLDRVTLLPGARIFTLRGAVEQGVSFEHVVEGTTAVSSDGPVLVARASVPDAPAAATPEAEIVLEPGDSVLYLENDAPWTDRNAGRTPAVVLVAFILSTEPPLAESAPGEPELGFVFEELDFVEPPEWAAVPRGPVALSLRQETLAPGAVFPAFAGDGVRLIGPEASPTAHLGRRPDGSARNLGDAPLTVYVVTFTSAAEAGTPAASLPAATPTG